MIKKGLLIVLTALIFSCNNGKVDERKLDEAGAKLQKTVKQTVDTAGAKLEKLKKKLDKDLKDSNP